MITVSRLYPGGGVARAVVDELKAAGLHEDDIGIIAPSRGGAAELLAGLSAFVLPGIGAVVASGWMANALAGAVAAGGITAMLVEAGVSEGEAARLVQGISQGSTLVTARVSNRDRDYYSSIMSEAPRPLGPAAAMPIQLRPLNTLGVKRP